jgi:hypothetical protein
VPVERDTLYNVMKVYEKRGGAFVEA